MKSLKKVILFAVLVAATAVITGCATPGPMGLLYTDVSLPAGLGNSELAYSKKSEASCQSFFGIIAVGDASINAACANGNISKVSWATYKAVNYFGFYGIYTVRVYGD